ncbi:MAG: rod shape-determining protein RodA, partial [Candidatus Omnitrophota bacterium]
MNKTDKFLLAAIFCIIAIGIAVLYSATRVYYSQGIVFRQIFWAIFSIIVLLAVLRIDYRRFVSIAYLLYGLTIFFLLFVLVMGKTRGGSQRWISMGFFNFQPSELAKISLILVLGSFIGKRKTDVDKITLLLKSACFVIPIFFLILIEPDLGGALILLPITFIMLFAGGVRVKHFVGIALLGMSAVPFFWHFLKDYQKQRLFVFINPNVDPLGSGYTIIQSKIAVGSGGLLGKGWLSGTQNQLNFLPERHTDFIFSVVGEEWGFLGALILILLYIVIIYRGLKIAEGTADFTGKLIAVGFVTVFSVQVIINIGMAIGFF